MRGAGWGQVVVPCYGRAVAAARGATVVFYLRGHMGGYGVRVPAMDAGVGARAAWKRGARCGHGSGVVLGAASGCDIPSGR